MAEPIYRLKQTNWLQGATRGWYDTELGTLSEQSFGLFLKNKAVDLAMSSSYIKKLITKLGSGMSTSVLLFSKLNQMVFG